jgi:hypothetical protein
MTEPRNPLEVVEEALAAIAGITVGSFGDGRPDAASYQTPAEFAAYAQEGARAALALVRKMRADAVVGSHDALVEALREIAEHEHPGNTLSGYHDLQAIARRALASLTDEEPTP